MKKQLALVVLASAFLLGGCNRGGDDPTGTSGGDTTQNPTSGSPTSGSPTSGTATSGSPTSGSPTSGTTTSGSVDPLNFEITNLLYTENFRQVVDEKCNVNPSDYYGGTFTHRIAEPSTTVTSRDALRELFDYCAFYKIPSITYTMSFYVDSTNLEEANIAWWDSTLCPGVVGMNAVDNGGNSMTVTFSYNDDACRFMPKQSEFALTSTTIPYMFNWSSDALQKISTIPYVGGTELDVHNSDQLIYAVTHGYKPIMDNDSPAKAIYTKAVSVLKDIIFEDMTDNEKLLAIEMWICSNSFYDSVSDDYGAYVRVDGSNNTEEIASYMSGFYADGVFNNKGGVCYGFAKAQALLAGLMGFDVRPTHGRMDVLSKSTHNPISTNTSGANPFYYYNAHGINLVKKGANPWGICDPTYAFGASINIGSNEDPVIVPFFSKHAISMNLTDWRDLYSAADEAAIGYHEDIADNMVVSSYDYGLDMRMANGDTWWFTSNYEENMQSRANNLLATLARYTEVNNITSQHIYMISLFPFVDDDATATAVFDYFNNDVGAALSSYLGGWYTYGFYRANSLNFYGDVVWIQY